MPPGKAVHPRWTSRLGAPLIAFVLTVAPSVSPAHAVEDARKVSVVSFGLLGDQGVFRSEATGLTSHGSPAGLAVKAGLLTQTLTPSNLADMLARTGVRYKVVVISACYSGVFIPRLANPDTLVITAADAGHPSFGCRDKAKWTYFGNAFSMSHSGKLQA